MWKFNTTALLILAILYALIRRGELGISKLILVALYVELISMMFIEYSYR